MFKRKRDADGSQFFDEVVYRSLEAMAQGAHDDDPAAFGDAARRAPQDLSERQLKLLAFYVQYLARRTTVEPYGRAPTDDELRQISAAIAPRFGQLVQGGLAEVETALLFLWDRTSTEVEPNVLWFRLAAVVGLLMDNPAEEFRLAQQPMLASFRGDNGVFMDEVLGPV